MPLTVSFASVTRRTAILHDDDPITTNVCRTSWQHSANAYHLQLQRVQNSAARIITGHSRDTRIAQLHEDPCYTII